MWHKNGNDGCWSLTSPDGVAPSQMVSVSASVISPCTIEVQKKISSGTGSPRWSRKKGHKMVVCMCCDNVGWVTVTYPNRFSSGM